MGIDDVTVGVDTGVIVMFGVRSNWLQAIAPAVSIAFLKRKPVKLK